MIGDGIIAVRKMKKIKQYELANAIGVTSSVIFRYEKNLQAPSKKRITEIAGALNVHPLVLSWFSVTTDSIDWERNKEKRDLYELVKPSFDRLIKEIFMYD